MADDDPLKFKVAAHIVEDLGLNLYTALPRVLAEFVANAYDADSPDVAIAIPHDEIVSVRTEMRTSFREEQKRAEQEGGALPEPLETRVLPATLRIVVEDRGHGMSRTDLSEKFLVAGRRRRLEDGASTRTPNGRLIMGRKGLGKLAGFGVAKCIEVVTRRAGETHATKIVLKYDDLVKARTIDQVDVPEERLEDGGGFAEGGTRIELSELLYDPAKSRLSTIVSELAEHFELIDSADFAIRLNDAEIEPATREHAYAWPRPDRPKAELVEHTIPTEDGAHIKFRYRMRFTPNDSALPASRRGVRVYARKRLAAAPSLLDADTNMHGFRMTDYLDGVVEADFLDAFDKIDYIATDRRSLRWESPLLVPLNAFLSAEIKEACKRYQGERDERNKSIVRDDAWTKSQIEPKHLSTSDQRLAFRIAGLLASACKQSVADPVYKAKLPEIVRAIGHGKVLASIAQLAEQDRPELHRIVASIVDLVHEEIDSFVAVARGRVNAIDALRKVVKDANFKHNKDEKQVQKLLERAPWMIDSTFGQVVSADESSATLYDRLAKDLAIGKHAPANAATSNERPDLVFLVGNAIMGRLEIVELKAANVSLESEHLDQLLAYMEDAEDWLGSNSQHPFKVHGHLIGRMDRKSQTKGARALRLRIKDAGPDSKWRVRPFDRVLTDAQDAHREFIAAHAKTKLG